MFGCANICSDFRNRVHTLKMTLPQADGGSFLAVRQVNSIYFPFTGWAGFRRYPSAWQLETDYLLLVFVGGGGEGGQPE